MKSIIPLLCFNIYIILEAYHDAKDGEKTHWVDWVLRAMWGSLISYWMFHVSYTALAFDFSLMFWTWFLFDTCYNLFSHRDSPIYVGQTSWWDKWFHEKFPKSPGFIMLICKIIALIISLSLFIISLN